VPTTAAPLALITGGATGLGRAIALRLGEAGFAIALTYRRSEADARNTVAKLESLGVRVAAFATDLVLPDAPDRLLGEVTERFGRVDVLVNNAAETEVIAFHDLAGLTAATWDRILETDLRAPFLCARAAAPWLRNAGGVIVNISSTAGLAPRGSSIAYSVAKAGLVHLTKCLAVAFEPDVRVVAIAPGAMPTRWPSPTSAAFEADAAADTDGMLQSVAELVLVGIQNRALNGSLLVADRGLLVGASGSN
jgi:3-oxoacyl-[acyl-carrier protein] reductase